MSVLVAFMPWLLGAAGLGLTLWLLLRYARADARKGVMRDADKAAIEVLEELGKRDVASDDAELERRRMRRKRARRRNA